MIRVSDSRGNSIIALSFVLGLGQQAGKQENRTPQNLIKSINIVTIVISYHAEK